MFLIPIPFWVFFFACVFTCNTVKADIKHITPALASGRLSGHHVFRIKFFLVPSVHSIPLMSTFCYCITRFQSPRRRRLIPFPLIRHSFAISPAFILSFPFPLTHAGSVPGRSIAPNRKGPHKD